MNKSLDRSGSAFVRRAVLTAIAAAGLAAFTTGPVASQERFPSRPIRIVVPFPAGATTDMLARLFAQRMTESLGQTVLVENVGGAGGALGADQVAKAAPDGHTLLFATTSVVNNRFMYKSVPFDADRDFVPIVLISKTPIVLVASQATGLKRLDALIAHAKANPGKLNIGSPGHGTAAHITAESLQRLAGFKLTHVPYRGSAPMIADLLGNQIDVVVDLLPTQIPQLKAGKYAGIALTSSARSAALPDLPTVAESGFPGFDALAWHGILAPAKTPPAIVKKLNAEIVNALKHPETQALLVKQAMQTVGNTPEEFAAFIRNDIAVWKAVAAEADVSVK
jgi:tripartite-type tricarboxylate transporter receptor subunit TctC